MILHMLEIMLYAFISLIFIYLIGKVILSFFELNITKELSFFSNYIVGIIICILLYSVAKTGFRTINIGLLPVIVSVIYLYRKRIKTFHFEFANIKYELFISVLIFLPIFIFQSCFYFDFFHNSLKTLHTDHYLYADLANSLKLFGVESKFTDLNYYNNASSLVPYHYAELWLTASYSEIFGISSIGSYFLIVIPLCASIFAVGLYSLLSKIKLHFLFKYFLIIGGLFISGVYISIYDNFEITKYGYEADNSILSLFNQKLCVIYIYLLFSSVLFVNGFRNISVITLSIIPFFSISFLPCLIGGIILYSIILIIRNRQVACSSKIGLLSVLYSGMFILLFYQIFKTSYSVGIIGNDVFLKKLISSEINITELKIFIGNNVYRLLRPFIFYAPFFIYIVGFVRRQKELSFLYFCIILSGIFTSSLLYGAMDSGQFASNSYIILNLSVFIGISLLLSEPISNRNKYLLYFFFLAIVFFNVVTTIKNKKIIGIENNKTILTQISNELKRETTTVLVFLNEKDFSSIPVAWWPLKNDLFPLAQYTDRNVIFSIGNPDLYFNKKKEISYTDSLFYKYLFPVNQQILEDGGVVNFINENNIKYLYLKEGVDLPEKINVDTCFVSEKINGSFYILK